MEPILPDEATAAPAPPDRRTGKRYTLILRAGKLVCAAGEFLCVLRDVSEKGLKVRLFHLLPETGEFEVELGGEERLPVVPVWRSGQNMGFRFAAGPIDIQALLAESGPFPKRHIRLRLAAELPVRLFAAGGVRGGRIKDISQHGALIAVPDGLMLSQNVQIEGEGLPSTAARVRWRRGNNYGVVFQQGFKLDELAALVAHLQLGAGGAGPPLRSSARGS